MLYTLLFSLLLVFIAIAILGFRIFFFKNKQFPSLHIGQNKHLKEKGISCATSQDREAQITTKTITKSTK
jgi:hypothetical protein